METITKVLGSDVVILSLLPGSNVSVFQHRRAPLSACVGMSATDASWWELGTPLGPSGRSLCGRYLYSYLEYFTARWLTIC